MILKLKVLDNIDFVKEENIQNLYESCVDYLERITADVQHISNTDYIKDIEMIVDFIKTNYQEEII